VFFIHRSELDGGFVVCVCKRQRRWRWEEEEEEPEKTEVEFQIQNERRHKSKVFGSTRYISILLSNRIPLSLGL